MPASRKDWERVGRLLADRRIQISARYANRRLFAEETGLNWRTLYDAEYGKRATFRPETVRSFETALQLVPGSIDRALAGGELEPAPAEAARLTVVSSAPRRTWATGMLRELLNRHPELAPEILRDALDDFPDDLALQLLGAQTAKDARGKMLEILNWLDFLADPRGNVSAGLPAIG